NLTKSAVKHSVSPQEAEEIFSNEPLIIVPDTAHSGEEQRFHALGRTNGNRLLFAVFTLRRDGSLIRPISIRDMKAKEGSAMPKKLKPVPSFRSEAEERKFWETHDSTDYVDW